jgi:hypothetical protein
MTDLIHDGTVVAAYAGLTCATAVTIATLTALLGGRRRRRDARAVLRILLRRGPRK